MGPRILSCLAALLWFLAICDLAESQDVPTISLERQADRIAVWLKSGTKRTLFTEYRFTGNRKPILYPVFAPGEVAITRHFPMQQGNAAEATDHPHHKSIWFAHGDVNGFDFWTEKASIRHHAIDTIQDQTLKVTNDWFGDAESVIAQDQTEISFQAGENWRWIDYRVTVQAKYGDLKFGDTKEGTFAVRTHPALRILNQDGQPQGRAFNSQGNQGAQVWGQPARWVHYRGTIEGAVYSITIMDHPTNLRHPTTWHAREYGLVAANPFGLSFFQKQPAGAGDFLLKQGQELGFRYGILIQRGEISVDQIQARFAQFTR